MSDSRPIALFDSGVGGLTVLNAVARRLPHENLLYLGDTARLPYGTKSPLTVQRYAIKAVSFLLERDAKALVIACNTATALALPAIRDQVGVPLLGVIEPGARAAVEALGRLKGRREGPIAVLATEATVASNAYGLAISALAPSVPVMNVACPLFVPLAEEGWTENEVAAAAAERYLEAVRRAGAPVAVLGCTHYPLLKRTIAHSLGPPTVLVDSADSTAAALDRMLPEKLRRLGPAAGETRLLVTDASERIRKVAGRFLGREATSLELVDLP
ncbi:MAG: glutamate racemase [Acidobacteria bacterium]|nr:glutamate racemase [Acidobacteriota bacterium]